MRRSFIMITSKRRLHGGRTYFSNLRTYRNYLYIWIGGLSILIEKNINPFSLKEVDGDTVK